MTAIEPGSTAAHRGVSAVINDESQQVLLGRSLPLGTPGVWSLPGGAVAHGEPPMRPSCGKRLAETV